MAKRIKPIGGGKWCWTENCTEHNTTTALLPPSEEECATLQKSTRELMKELPSKQQILESGNMEDIKKAREAQINSEYARLHLAITPRGKKSLVERARTAPTEKRPPLISMVHDSVALEQAYQRNYQRFHYGSGYTNQRGVQCRAIPVSMDNISSVNDWVQESTPEPLTEEEGVLEPEQRSGRNKTKVFRKKNKIFYRNADGEDTEIKTSSYLVRADKDSFDIVDANQFEKEYTSTLEEKANRKLDEIRRERFFPSTNLSTFIQM